MPGNIVDLINAHLDKDGWILCSHCSNKGYIKKEFQLQEGGTWEPNLKGIIPLGNPGEVYQPFVFLATHSHEPPSAPVRAAWFSYYKDTRKYEGNRRIGGSLKMGYGPGGPPVLGLGQVRHFLDKVRGLGISV